MSLDCADCTVPAPCCCCCCCCGACAESPHEVTVTTRDSSGNSRQCTFDVYTPVEENELQLLELTSAWDLPLSFVPFPESLLMFYVHSLTSSDHSSSLASFEVRECMFMCMCVFMCAYACACLCAHPCGLVSLMYSTTRLPLIHFPYNTLPCALQADLSNLTRVVASFAVRSSTTPFVLRLHPTPQRAYFVVDMQWHAEGTTPPPLYGDQGGAHVCRV